MSEYTIRTKTEAFERLDAEIQDGKTYTLTIKEKKPRRSLEANAYCWALIDQLAERLHVSKEDIYRGYIKNIGGNNDVIATYTIAVPRIREHWRGKGLGWITEEFPSEYDGYTNVVLYYGSSSYNSTQMSRLIDLVEMDCKSFGIQTLDDEQTARLIESWGERHGI